MKTCLQTAVGILLAASITAAAAGIVKTEINKTNILSIFKELREIKSALVRIEEKI